MRSGIYIIILSRKFKSFTDEKIHFLEIRTKLLLSEKCLQQKLSIETGCSDKIQEKLYAM